MLFALLACRSEPPPDVLLITLDTLRADVLGSYGNSGGASPTLDRLASEGLRFDRAYTVTPLTIPAHSSLFTGKWPPNHGVQDNGAHFLGEGEITLAEVLDDKGYDTMAAVGAEVTSHHWGFDQGFDAYFDDLGARDAGSNRWRVERRGDEVVDDALAWLGEAHAAPSFAWVHLFDVHAPYDPPAEFKTQYPHRPYLAELAWTDHQVDRLLQGVDLESTWVIVVSDHGEGLGSHGEQFHGVLLYDATTRIPLIIRPPGGREPLVVEEAVSIVDVAPTVLGLLGHQGLAADGTDLSGLFSGGTAPERSVYIESLYAYTHYGWAKQLAVASTDWKFFNNGELHARGNESTDHADDELEAVANLSNDLALLTASFSPPEESTPAQLDPERLAQLAALGYLTTVVEVADDAVLPDPRDKLPVLREVERMRSALQAEDYAEARAIGERLVADEPGLVEPRSLLVVTLNRLGDLEGALAAAEALEAASPTAQSATSLASVRMSMGDIEEGLLHLGTAVERDPYLASPRVLLCRALFQQGRLPELAHATGDAYTALPEVPEIVGLRGLALSLAGDPDQGELLLRSALQAEPDQPLLNHGLGLLARKRGDETLAELHFLAEVSITDPALPSRRVLVELYASQDRYTDQLEQLDAIVAVEPPSPLTHHSIAQALFNLERFDDAHRAIQDCRALSPQYPACAMLEANILKKQGRDAEATAAYEEALRLVDAAP